MRGILNEVIGNAKLAFLSQKNDILGFSEKFHLSKFMRLIKKKYMKSIALNNYKDYFLDFKKNKETGGRKKEKKERREGKLSCFLDFINLMLYLVTQLSLNFVTVAHQASLSIWILQARILK